MSAGEEPVPDRISLTNSSSSLEISMNAPSSAYSATVSITSHPDTADSGTTRTSPAPTLQPAFGRPRPPFGPNTSMSMSSDFSESDSAETVFGPSAILGGSIDVSKIMVNEPSMTGSVTSSISVPAEGISAGVITITRAGVDVEEWQKVEYVPLEKNEEKIEKELLVCTTYYRSSKTSFFLGNY